MTARTLADCGAILAGAAVMVLSWVRAGVLEDAVAFVSEGRRGRIRLFLAAHRWLMVLFFFGYLAVAAAYAAGQRILSETVVSAIFLCGSVFVYLGIAVQSQLLAEVERTLHGLLPICSECKRIRRDGGEPSDPDSWTQLEAYMSQRAGVRFSHGYCPGCYEKQLRRLDEMERGR